MSDEPTNRNQPAFPQGDAAGPVWDGMTKRELAAVSIYAGMVSDNRIAAESKKVMKGVPGYQVLAMSSVTQADALFDELEK